MPTFYNGNASNVTEPSATIIDATNTTPIVIQTSAAHLFSDGDRVVVLGVRGNTAANSPYSPFTPWKITFIDATHFSLNGSVGNGAYVDGGEAVDVSLNPPAALIADGSDLVNASTLNPPEESSADREQYLWERVILLDSIHAPTGFVNWHSQQWLAADPGTSATAIVALTTTNTRVDNSAECFYSPTFRRWFALGVNTNDIYLMGDEGYLEKKTTGVAHKYTHGVESNGKVLLFASADFTSGTIDFERSDASMSSWATVSIANPGWTHGSIQDSVVLANGHIMLVGGTLGGGFDALRSWTSSDNGTTWTAHSVHAIYTGGPQYLAGCSVGKSQRVFAWLYDTAGANGGDIVFYTDNEGASWTATSAIAHGNIRDIIYVVGFDRYLVLTTAGYALTTDPTDPTKYDWNTSVEVFAAATDGENIVYAQIDTVTGSTNVRVSQDMLTSSWDSHGDTHQPVYFVAYGALSGQWGQFATLSSYAFRASNKVLA
jgi:hypothetical protein